MESFKPPPKMGAMMNKIPALQQQQSQPPQQINAQPPVMSQYNTFENVVPNQIPCTQIPGSQMPGAEMPATQMPVTDMPPNMFKMQRGRSKKLLLYVW